MTTEQLVKWMRKNADENPCQFPCEKCDEADCFTPVFRAAADLIEQQTARIAELEAKVPRWIPVTERLPKKQAWYHVAIRDKKTMRVSVELDLYAVETAKNFGHEIGFCKANRWPEREELIAWMPLPEAPKEDE